MANNWNELTDLQIKNIPSKPGAYKIRICKSKCKPIKINRFIGVDKDGIIDIGQSKDLRNRLRTFKKCVETHDYGGHMAGWRFNYLKLSQKLKFPILEFTYKKCNSKKQAYEQEHKWMKEYVHEHKELPPLNYSYNWSDE